MNKTYFYLLLFLILPCIVSAESPAGSKAKTFTVVVDAGHGGKDGGTRSARTLEKNVALQVAIRLKKAMEAKGIKVVLTRTSDVFVPLYERIGMANRVKADLFISLHCNSLPYNKKNRASIRGTETFVSGYGRLDEQDAAIRENASILLEKDYKKNYGGYDPKDPESIIILSLMKNAYRTKSIRFASLMETEYKKAGRHSRGVQEKSLAVLARAGMPAVLTEMGFLSSPADEKYMTSAAGQNEIVDGMVAAVMAYKKTSS